MEENNAEKRERTVKNRDWGRFAIFKWHSRKGFIELIVKQGPKRIYQPT